MTEDSTMNEMFLFISFPAILIESHQTLQDYSCVQRNHMNINCLYRISILGLMDFKKILDCSLKFFQITTVNIVHYLFRKKLDIQMLIQINFECQPQSCYLWFNQCTAYGLAPLGSITSANTVINKSISQLEFILEADEHILELTNGNKMFCDGL